MLKPTFIKQNLLNTLILLLISACCYSHAEPLNFASLNVGLDNDEGNLIDAYLSYSLTNDLQLSLGVGEYSSETADEEFTSGQNQVGLNGQITSKNRSTYNWSLNYQTWGVNDVIETQDTTISLGYFFAPDSYKYNWHISLDYETGKLELFIKPQFSVRARSIISDRNAWRFSTGFLHNTGSGWISFLKRDYEENLPAINQRPLLQNAIKSIALSQAYALSKEELTLGYEWLFETMDLGLDYNRIISVVDNHRNQYLSIFTRHYAGQNLMINFRLEREVNENFLVFTAGVGLIW